MRISDWSSDLCSSDLNGGLEEVPLLIRVLGHGDEVAAEEYGGDAVDFEQALGERRLALGLLRAGKIGGAGLHDGPAGQELQSGRVGCLLRLDEHRGSPSPRSV